MKPGTDSSEKSARFEVFFDGDCPLCKREIEMIRRKDKRGSLMLTNIADPDFSSQDRTLEQLMREIHGRFPDGRYVTGVEVFRQIYDSIGWGWLVRPTRLPLVGGLLDFGYRCFARIRFAHAMRRISKSPLAGKSTQCTANKCH